jgi:hypothetical protein
MRVRANTLIVLENRAVERDIHIIGQRQKWV